MNTVTSLVGLLLWVAALAAFWHPFSQGRKLPPALVLPGFVATLPLAFMLRGLLGDVSLALPALAWLVARPTPLSFGGRRLLLGTAIAAAALTLSAAGALPLDLYAPGYSPGPLMLGVALGVLAAYRWLPALGWLWLLGLGLQASGLHPSPNLWDALIDFPSLLLAAYLLLRGRRPALTRDGASAGCG